MDTKSRILTALLAALIGLMLLIAFAQESKAATVPVLNLFGSPMHSASSFPTGTGPLTFADSDITFGVTGGPYNLESGSFRIGTQSGTVTAVKIHYMEGTACYSDTFNPHTISSTIVTGSDTATTLNTGLLNVNFSGTDCTIAANDTDAHFEAVDAGTLTPLGGAATYFNAYDSGFGSYYTSLYDTPFINPPTTQFNEVVDYIYDPDLDNSFGTSSVGARFSIAEYTWLDSVGVTLTDPLGAVVWNGSVAPTQNGIYDVTTEYDFDITGSYLLKAYFVQDGQAVDNPVSFYIIINVPTWSFDPLTGDLLPTASTSIATSTLDAYKIECNVDNFILNGICKLVVGFFVPSAGAMQMVQASFSNLMTKAPFSFFVQSKAVLDGFRIGDNSEGGTFSITLYGSEVDILSPDTAAAVGLDSEVLAFLRMIMVVALWLMLAWYLYWRIASIFGV